MNWAIFLLTIGAGIAIISMAMLLLALNKKLALDSPTTYIVFVYIGWIIMAIGASLI